MTPQRKPAEFGRRLRLAREALGLVRRQLAADAKISAATLRNIEVGRHLASGATVHKIVAALTQHDSVRARWVALGAGPSDASLEQAPPPTVASLRARRVGEQLGLTLELDMTAIERILGYLCQRATAQDRGDLPLVSVTISLQEQSNR